VHKHPIEKIVLFISLYITAFMAIIFLGFIPSSGMTLFYGWIFSCVMSLIGYLFGLWAIRRALKYKSGKVGFWLTILKSFITYILHAIAIIVLVWVDKHQSGLTLWNSHGIDSVSAPISIFTYLGGVAVIPISTVVANFFYKKER